MAVNEVARVYANSLVAVGQKSNLLPQIEEEMKFLSDLMKEDKDFSNFIASPGFSKDKKKEFINKVFSGRLSEYIVNLLNLLIENERQTAIFDIYQAMIDQIDIINGIRRVTVISNKNLDATVLEKIKQKLKTELKKEIILSQKVDENILGGIIIKIADLVIDGSLLKDLKIIRNNLLNSKVRSEVAYED